MTSRSLAARGNDWTNVLDYGADPTGATDCTTALNAAVTALPSSRGTLYFPPGRYKWTNGGSFTISGKTNLTIVGFAAELYDGNTAGGRPFVVIDKTNSYVKMQGLAFNGNASSRVGGAHQLIFNASNSTVSDCTFTNGSQFTFYIGSDSSSQVKNVTVTNCQITNTWADGFHIWNVFGCLINNCTITYTGDDGIGIVNDSVGPSYNAAYGQDITVSNCFLNSIGYGSGAVSGTGIKVFEAQNVSIVNNDILTTYQAAITVGRYNSTSYYNTQINISGNKIKSANGLVGDLGAINTSSGQTISVTNNQIDDCSSGSGISFLDCSDLIIQANRIRNVANRGIRSNDITTGAVNAGSLVVGKGYIIATVGTTNWVAIGAASNTIGISFTATGVGSGTGVATTVALNCYRVWIKDNNCDYTLAGETIYCVPPTGRTINDFVISGNTAGSVPGGNYIFYNNVSNGIVANNVSVAGGTVGAGGTVSGVKAYNNTLWPKLGIGADPSTTSPNSDLIVTRSVPSTTAQASIVVGGALTAAYDLHPNAFRDITTFTPTVAAEGYCSFDSQTTMAGTVALNHYRGYQVRNAYTGTNTLGEMSGFMTANMGLAGTGTVTFMRGFYVSQPAISGGGTVGQFDGIYMDQLTNSTGNVNAIYIAGNNRVFMAGGQIVTSAALVPPAGATTARGAFTFDQASQTGLAVMNSSATRTGTFVSFCNDGGTVQGTISQTNGTTVAYNTTSDARLKTNVRNFPNSGALIDALQPRIFDWNMGVKDNHGFIAQELYEVYPEAVTKGDDDVTITKAWSVDYSKLTPMLVAEVKALRARVAALESKP